jgi:hypothetical protein
MTWAKDWSGWRAALFFSKMDGPAFVVIVTFSSLGDQGGKIGMDVHIKLVMESLHEVVLDEILLEDFAYEQRFQLGQAQKVLPFEDRVMTIRVKNEMVFYENLFILDLLFRVWNGVIQKRHQKVTRKEQIEQKYKREARYWGEGTVRVFDP